MRTFITSNSTPQVPLPQSQRRVSPKQDAPPKTHPCPQSKEIKHLKTCVQTHSSLQRCVTLVRNPVFIGDSDASLSSTPGKMRHPASKHAPQSIDIKPLTVSAQSFRGLRKDASPSNTCHGVPAPSIAAAMRRCIGFPSPKNSGTKPIRRSSRK